MALYDKDTYNKTISVKPKFGMKGANGKEEEVISRGETAQTYPKPKSDWAKFGLQGVNNQGRGIHP